MTDESGRMPWFLRWYTLPAYAPLAIAGISEAVEMCQKYGLERIVSEFNQIPGALGVVVYGGGGIMPDIYVPIDTSGYTPYYYELSAKGVLNDFVFRYLSLKQIQYKSVTQLLNDFSLPDSAYPSKSSPLIRLTSMKLSRVMKD